MASVRACTAPFDALYAARCCRPVQPPMDPVFTIAGRSERRRYGSAARLVRTMPSTLTWKTRRNSSSGLSSTVPRAPTPALLTRTSSPPKSSAARSTAARADCSSLTSVVISSTPVVGAAGFKSREATRAPRATSSSTVARPMPEAPPVTTADISANSPVTAAPDLDSAWLSILSPRRSKSAPGNKQHDRAILACLCRDPQLLSGSLDRALSNKELSTGKLYALRIRPQADHSFSVRNSNQVLRDGEPAHPWLIARLCFL